MAEEPKKKLMLLGGLRYLLPVMEAAHRHGVADSVLCLPIHHQHTDTDQ